jgi:hypothetical protein
LGSLNRSRSVQRRRSSFSFALEDPPRSNIRELHRRGKIVVHPGSPHDGRKRCAQTVSTYFVDFVSQKFVVRFKAGAWHIGREKRLV